MEIYFQASRLLPCTFHTGSWGLRPGTFHKCNGWRHHPCRGTLLLRGGRGHVPGSLSCRPRWPSRPRSRRSGRQLRVGRCSKLSAAGIHLCLPMTSCRNISSRQTRRFLNAGFWSCSSVWQLLHVACVLSISDFSREMRLNFVASSYFVIKESWHIKAQNIKTRKTQECSYFTYHSSKWVTPKSYMNNGGFLSYLI